MKIGIIGLPYSGKSTVFSALTGMPAPASSYGDAKAEPKLAVVSVEDERIDDLSRFYMPKKTTYATLDLADFVGLQSGSARDGIFSSSTLQHVRSSDALALVLRNFDGSEAGPDLTEVDPLRDSETVMTEFLISDFMQIERRLEHMKEERRRGRGSMAMDGEEKLLRRIADALDKNVPVRNFELSKHERKTISGFQFLTAKPLQCIVNSDENLYGDNDELIRSIPDAIEFAGSFEMALAHMEEHEAAEFMHDMGIQNSARNRLATACYKLLGYISFFTVGEDEVRAWTIREGDNAVDAAGTIHSDLARGFIRAECFSYDDLMAEGSEKAVRTAGKFQLQGKNYQVRDGDILNIRFSA